MGMVFVALLPLPGLLAATAYLGGLALLLVIHARRERPWRSVLVRAAVGLVVMWIAITLASLTLLDGAPGAREDAGWLLASFVLAVVLLLAIAGGLLAWITGASRAPEANRRA